MYDNNGNRTTTIEADGATTAYDYDALNRLTKVAYDYDSLMRVRNACLVPPCPNGNAWGPGGVNKELFPKLEDPVHTERFTYDAVGNRLTLERDAVVVRYTYDKANRLTASTGQGKPTAFEYDDNGNLIKENGPDGVTTYSYDAAGKLTAVVLPDGSGIKNLYDAFERRVVMDETYWQNKNQIFVDVTKTLYGGMGYQPETLGRMGMINPRLPGMTSGASGLAALVGQNALMEFTEHDNPMNAYAYANGELISKRMWGFKGRKDPGADGNVRRRGNELFYHTDDLGSIIDITDHLGENIIKNRYLAYGAPVAGDFSPYGRFGFTGMSLEEKIGKYYAGSRFYDYRAGRFQTQDFNRGGIINPATLHLYQYATNNPVNNVDVLGYKSLKKRISSAVKGGLLGGVFGPLGSIFGGIGGFFEGTGGFLGRISNPFVRSYTGMLTYYQRNRQEIIATGMIVVAVAAVVASGGTASPLLGPVLWGAGIGGVTAGLAGGNIYQGIAMGAFVGAIAGGAGQYINTEVGSFWAQVGKGAAKGGLFGAGFGGLAGYAGGAGTNRDIWSGIYKGAIVGAALGALKPMIIGRNITSEPEIQRAIQHGQSASGYSNNLDFSNITVREGGLLSELNGAHQGITIGNLINIDAGVMGGGDLSSVMGEELWHVAQYQEMGIPGFLGSYSSDWVSNGFDYDKIWIEIVAKFMSRAFYCPGYCY